MKIFESNNVVKEKKLKKKNCDDFQREMWFLIRNLKVTLLLQKRPTKMQCHNWVDF